MTEAPSEASIMVMAKATMPGAVITRLRLDPWEAAGLQEAMISGTVERAHAIVPVTVAVSPAEGLSSV